MYTRAILWLDVNWRTVSYIKYDLQAFCNESDIEFFVFDNPVEFMKKSIELNDLGVNYVVITETDFVGYYGCGESGYFSIPSSIYLEKPQDLISVVNCNRIMDWAGIFLYQKLYYFDVINDIQHDSRLKKPPIIILSYRSVKDVEKFIKDNIGDYLKSLIFHKFCYDKEAVISAIELCINNL